VLDLAFWGLFSVIVHLRMYAFVVLDLVFSAVCQEIGLGERLQNDLFCGKWYIKPNSINQSTTCLVHHHPADSWKRSIYCIYTGYLTLVPSPFTDI